MIKERDNNHTALRQSKPQSWTRIGLDWVDLWDELHGLDWIGSDDH